MDNILYIGPYREFSGSGNAARLYIKALIKAGYNVSIRPIYNYYIPYPQEAIESEIMDLETNSSIHYHKIIQHCYPHQLVFNNRFDQHITIQHLESLNNNNAIADQLSFMDTIIVGSSFVKTILSDLNIDAKKISIIPEPIDLDLINSYRENNPIEIQDLNYKFYTLGSFSDRKNLSTLLMCFLIFSNQYPDIDLIIKLRNLDNVISPQECIDYEFEKIYSTVRQNFIKKPKILIGNTVYENILYLHNNNDCYINLSHGESFGYSALEALSFNNNIIVTSNIGFDDIIVDNCGFKIPSQLTVSKDKDRIFPVYNSLYQKWYEPDIDNILHKMSLAINESKAHKKQRINKQNEHMQNFTLSHVSNLLSKL